MPGGADKFETALADALSVWRLPVKQDQIHRLRAHFEAVVETNRAFNLTRITDPVDAAVKHYADSLALLMWVERCKVGVKTVVDIGTGAGFPAFPLAVMRPAWRVTAIDATRKKVDFLRRTAVAIGVGNLQCVHAHSEHWRPASRFDLVVCRAVASMPKMLEQTARHVSPGGWIVAYKTASTDSGERAAADAAARKLRLGVCERYDYSLDLEGTELERTLRVFRKSGGR